MWIFVCFGGKRAIDVTDMEAITGWAKAVSDVSVTQTFLKIWQLKENFLLEKKRIDKQKMILASFLEFWKCKA